MPVFTEYSSSPRDLRVLPSFAPPLPRLSSKFEPEPGDEKYEVVIVGAGPAGMMMHLLLTRYGLSDDSVLCVDAKPEVLKSGQADGLQCRTLEVLKSLDLADEILTQGCQQWEVAFWDPSTHRNADTGKVPPGIERTSLVSEVRVAARFPYCVTIHQGRIERILETDLLRYSKRGIQRSTRLVNVTIDEDGDPEFPVKAQLEDANDGSCRRTIRSKYLVGADGAHSVVRRSMGLKLQGESTNHIWGVVDLVLDTDFPDIRRRCAIHSAAGSVMVIPRERIPTGEYLTRLYVQIPGVVKADNDQEEEEEEGKGEAADKSKKEAKTRRNEVTLESILAHAEAAFRPYTIKPKGRDAVDWWTAYQIGQRVANEFAVHDSEGVNRVFIVGDACHTHSPKAGQGMNVSMMDSHNLAWKLAYAVHDLSANANAMLDTYHSERHRIAQDLIAFDRSISSMFSGQIDPLHGGITHEQFQQVFSTGNGLTTGCGVEYGGSCLVEKPDTEDDITDNLYPIQGTDYLAGILQPGRRLPNVRLKRHADGCKWDMQDDLPCTGRFRVICLTSSDLLDPSGKSATALRSLASMYEHFPPVVEQIVVHPRLSKDFMWQDIPSQVKKWSEMRFYSGYEMDGVQDVYAVYGVDPDHGALVVVRPDGYIGLISCLDGTTQVENYLRGCLKYT
ncbi:hypothetical protein ASPZODRAFT_2113935 [Penicilliopsis zonata CBS 506.65]|uniref:FAD-binding domain-containing protein n=1 Tax=Penicilliopsis zonata CBS 506.65 TaxID=1073090 RepID=A0A1L9S9U0_9EURO|nr:hypothetical protein ASPZODRAFT_2113935 [Penicilliopsis zonata CBS 506.65]OJJ43909.1 hypothetical protein ASPZODRAFT_2113935 [Penicilliopsis zonata CBS 506.65]